MNGKGLVIGLIIGCLLGVLLWTALDHLTGKTSIGRYHLYQGSVRVKLEHETPEETWLFLVDTATGEVKYYTAGTDKDGHPYGGWKLSEFGSKP